MFGLQLCWPGPEPQGTPSHIFCHQRRGTIWDLGTGNPRRISARISPGGPRPLNVNFFCSPFWSPKMPTCQVLLFFENGCILLYKQGLQDATSMLFLPFSPSKRSSEQWIFGRIRGSPILPCLEKAGNPAVLSSLSFPFWQEIRAGHSHVFSLNLF